MLNFSWLDNNSASSCHLTLLIHSWTLLTDILNIFFYILECNCFIVLLTRSIAQKVKVKSLSCDWLCATPWTVAYQAPPSIGFSRQEYWSGCHFLLQNFHDWSLFLACVSSSYITCHTGGSSLYFLFILLLTQERRSDGLGTIQIEI